LKEFITTGCTLRQK